MHDVETLKIQRFQGETHRRGQPRRFRSLDLEAVASLSGHDEQVELGAGVRGPVEALIGARRELMRDLADDESLPGRAHLGMRDERITGVQTQQRVEDPRIADVDLRRPYLPLADVLVPRLKLRTTNTDVRRSR